MMSGSSSSKMVLNLTMRVTNNSRKVSNEKMSVRRLMKQGLEVRRPSSSATASVVRRNPLSDNCGGRPMSGSAWIENAASQRLTLSRGHSVQSQLQSQRQRQRSPCVRQLTTEKAVLMDEEELRNRLDTFQDLFVEARLCIEDARDSADTTYFDEEAELAKDAVDEAMAAFDGLVNDLHDIQQKNSVLRSNGLKAEQLKGELQLVLTGGH